MKGWPLPSDFQEAMQSHSLRFKDNELKAGMIATNPNGLPFSISGNFAIVFKIKCATKAYAVRCFTKRIEQRRIHYFYISKHLKKVKIPFLVKFDYLDKELLIKGVRYPILKMEWVSNYLQMHECIEKAIINNNIETLKKLETNWLSLSEALYRKKIAHGDLQHSNILVRKTFELKLVDYDAMFVPQLEGYESYEIGHYNYQHPNRTATHFDLDIDKVSKLVIHVSLRALISDPSLWAEFHNSGENLLFTSKDLKNPINSPLFKKLLNFNGDPKVQKLTYQLFQICSKPLPAPTSIIKDENHRSPLFLFKRFILATISIVTILLIGYIVSLFISPFGIKKGRIETIKIEQGTKLSDISHLLKERKLINSSKKFTSLVIILGYEKKLKAGYYSLSSGMSYFDLLKILMRGQSEFKKITIPEGGTSRQITKIFKKKYINFDDNEFLNLLKKKISLRNWT